MKLRLKLGLLLMETSLEVKVIVNQLTTINPFLGNHESGNDDKTLF